MAMVKTYPLRYKILITLIFVVVIILFFLYRAIIWEKLVQYYKLFKDEEQSKAFIRSFGMGAPAVFIIFQVLQVLFAPVPGEATGFIGGILFGAGQGFVYSSIGLSIGSWINFSIGRFFGKRYVRKLIPDDKLEWFDSLLKRQGIVVISILFVFPGFPKDYLCYFLGLSTFPWKVFIILASFGRMPGTFMLSLQGAFLFRSYGWFALLLGLCLLLAGFGYWYRNQLYQWIERLNNR